MRLLKLSLLFTFAMSTISLSGQMFANTGDIEIGMNSATIIGEITLEGAKVPTGTEIAAFEMDEGNIVGHSYIDDFGTASSFFTFVIYGAVGPRNQLNPGECFRLAVFFDGEVDSFDVEVVATDPRLCPITSEKENPGLYLTLDLTKSNSSRSTVPSEFGPYSNQNGANLSDFWDGTPITPITGGEGPLNLLPVEYSSITLTNNDCKQVSFDWTTSSEINNEGFYVERKVEGGRKWETLDFVAGNGTSIREIDYSFKDVEIVKDKSLKVVYYRLKQIDYDGRIEYSETKAIRLNCGNARFINVFPSPSKDEINLEVNYEGLFQENVTIEIYSMDGQLMQRRVMLLTDKEAVLLQTDDFAPGVYSVHAFTNSQIIAHTRFTKI